MLNEQPLGVSVRIPNLTERFRNSPNAIVINGFNLAEEEEQRRLADILSLHCEGDVISAIPSCDCGFSTGEPMNGMTCHRCSTMVKPLTERSLAPVAWMRPPEGVHAFITPQIWTILSKALTISSVNLLEYFCNPMASMPADPNRQLRKVLNLNIPQGMNYFHDNFDMIMERLFEAGAVYNAGNRRSRADLRQFIRTYRDLIFVEALPIPSKMSFVTEKTVTRTYAGKTMYMAMEAINTITATENSVKPLSLRVRQGRAAKANAQMAQYYQEFIGNDLARKPGQFRKHIVGSRLHYTFRAVISSLSNNHAYDELHLPWSMSVKVFDTHLTSKLFQRGFSDAQAATYLAEHVHCHSDLLEEIFNELIDEAPGNGFPVLLNRNPTLMRGSIQRMWVTQIKVDPLITSISMSVLSLKAPNRLHTTTRLSRARIPEKAICRNRKNSVRMWCSRRHFDIKNVM